MLAYDHTLYARIHRYMLDICRVLFKHADIGRCMLLYAEPKLCSGHVQNICERIAYALLIRLPYARHNMNKLDIRKRYVTHTLA